MLVLSSSCYVVGGFFCDSYFLWERDDIEETEMQKEFDVL
jgi:hypothetical protein